MDPGKTLAMNPIRTTLALFALSALAVGCYYDNEEELYGPSCDSSVFSFSTKIMPIIQAKCQASSCHGAGQATENGELLNYDQVMAFVNDNGAFRHRVIEIKDMPDGSSLTPCELELITKWLDAGTPND